MLKPSLTEDFPLEATIRRGIGNDDHSLGEPLDRGLEGARSSQPRSKPRRLSPDKHSIQGF